MYQQTIYGGFVNAETVPIETEACSVCKGKGTKIGRDWAACPCDCLEECPTCHGMGEIEIAVETKCPACYGEGTHEEEIIWSAYRRMQKIVHARYGRYKPFSIADWWK